MDEVTRQHVKFSDKHQLVGTARYASINTLFGYAQSRRDDLESIFYALVYLLYGKLPWQGIRAQSQKDKNDKIRDLKLIFSSSEEFIQLPKELKEIIDMIRRLSFNEDPDYNKIRILLRELSIKRGYSTLQDWEPLQVRNRVVRTTLISTKTKKFPAKPSIQSSIFTRNVAPAPLASMRKSSRYTIDPRYSVKKKKIIDMHDLIAYPTWSGN